MALETFPVKKPPLISVLGFDFGGSRIGVAFGQSLTGTAEALPLLNAKDGIPDWDELEKLEVVEETSYVKHVRFKKPVCIMMDGKKRISIILKYACFTGDDLPHN